MTTVAKFGIDMVLHKDMEAREKLQEARYFLQQIKKLEDETRVRTFGEDEFKERNLVLRANISAFILAWHSIPEIMYYDFAEWYSLGVTRQEKATREHFRHLAKALARRDEKYSEAAHSYDWLDEQQKRLFEAHTMLAEMRHVVTHRGIVVTERGEKQVVETVEAVNTSGVGPYFIALDQTSHDWHSPMQVGPDEEPQIIGVVSVAGVRPVKETSVKELYVYGVGKPIVPSEEEEKEQIEAFTYLTSDPDKVPISDRCESAYNDTRKLVDDAWARMNSGH